jgi:hypothetical protein
MKKYRENRAGEDYNQKNLSSACDFILSHHHHHRMQTRISEFSLPNNKIIKRDFSISLNHEID